LEVRGWRGWGTLRPRKRNRQIGSILSAYAEDHACVQKRQGTSACRHGLWLWMNAKRITLRSLVRRRICFGGFRRRTWRYHGLCPWGSMSLLRMRCYGNDRDYSSLRAIIPEDTVGSWCFLLDIPLEDLFPVRPLEGPKFVRLQRRMAQVGFKKAEAFPDGFKNIPLRGIVFNLLKVGVGLVRENQFVHRVLFSVPGERSSLHGSFLRKPGQNFL